MIKGRTNMEFTDLTGIIEFALFREKDAVQFYTKCQEKAERPEIKTVLKEMAEEEKHHVVLLENFDVTSLTQDALESVNDPQMESYIIEKPYHPNMSYQELLQLAIHREADSHKLYTLLSEKSGNSAAEKLFQRLASEELKHKERLEAEYDSEVFQEN